MPLSGLARSPLAGWGTLGDPARSVPAMARRVDSRVRHRVARIYTLAGRRALSPGPVMGFVRKSPVGSYRACWRDPAGRQRSRTFKTKREANAFLAEVETALNRGLYVAPDAGHLRLSEYAVRWLAGRNDEKATAARDASIMRNHVLPPGDYYHWTRSSTLHPGMGDGVGRPAISSDGARVPPA